MHLNWLMGGLPNPAANPDSRSLTPDPSRFGQYRFGKRLARKCSDKLK
jgi:hypothetical protein